MGSQHRNRVFLRPPHASRSPRIAVAAVIGLSCAARGGGPYLHFTDATAESGLTSSHEIYPTYAYLYYPAGGVAADFNNDGYHDIFHLGSMEPNRLFINNQDGTFTDQAAEWGVRGPFHSFGASSADFNNDGYIDIFITAFGDADQSPQPNSFKLYRNNGPDEHGNYSFTDIAHEAGVSTTLPGTPYKEGTGSAWGDYDLDGDLDLFVTAYSELFPGNRLFRNDGTDENNITRFTDVSVEAGLFHLGTAGFLAAFADFDDDLYPELIIIGDAGSTKFFRNNGDGTFTNDTVRARGVSTANGMGIDIADINNDGLLDFYESNITFTQFDGPGNILEIQNPDGSFDNRARSSGCYRGYWGWGVLATDFDHDGDKDLAETNGFTTHANKPTILYLNDGDATSWTESAEACGFYDRGQGRGLVQLDADNDGDMDMVNFRWGDSLVYYRNDLINEAEGQGAGINWSRVKLDTSKRRTLAPQGIGSMITFGAGDQRYRVPLLHRTNHCSTSVNEAHIGLADEPALDFVRVRWPDGSHTTYTDTPINEILTLRAPVHPADYDGSDTVDIDDIFEFIKVFMSADLRADHNADERLDYFDLSMFLMDYRAAISNP